MREAKKTSEETPTIPNSTITPTTIRMAFRAPPPEAGAGVGVGATGGTAPMAAGAGDGESIAAPHLLQNLVPGAILAPQELQNAMGHLRWTQRHRRSARVYRRLGRKQNEMKKEASQTRDYWVAKSATLRAACLDPSQRKERAAQDDREPSST